MRVDERLNTRDLRKIGNIGKISKLHRNRNAPPLPAVRHPTRKLEFVSNNLSMIVSENSFFCSQLAPDSLIFKSKALETALT